MKLNEKIKHYRTKNNLSQQDLADHLFVSRQAVSKWEQDSSTPDIKTIKKLADLFEVTTDDLMGEEASVKSNKDVPFKLIYGLTLLAFFMIVSQLILTMMLNSPFIQFFLLPGMIFLTLFPVVIIFVYGLKTNEYALIAGYDPKKNYNITYLRKSLMSILMMILVGAIAFLFIFYLIYFIEELEDSYFGLILLFSFMGHLVLSILIVNIKYKGKLVIK